MHLLLALLLSVTIKDGGAALRAGCDGDSAVVEQLTPGTEVSIRYSLSGQSVPCYKVVVKTDTGSREGYLPASAIEDLSSFEAARKQGAVLGTREVLAAVAPPAASAIRSNVGPLAQRAASLIESSQPAQALALLEPELKKRPDAGLLALAGAAAWRADDPQRALELWKRSLAIDPNPQVQELYDRVERETKGDQSKQRLVGARVLLRYEGTAISVETAREMAAVVDQEFARISAQLGCTTGERIVTIAQSKEAYRKTTAAAEWSAGQYDGRIRVPVFDSGSLDADTKRTLSHETTHACLTMLGRWPAWLQEGVAQYMSGQVSSAADREQISQLVRSKRLPSLTRLGGDWSGLDTQSARAAYAMALRAVEIFNQDFGGYGLRNLLRNPEKLAGYTAELDRRLGL